MSWQLQAACRGDNADLFVGEPNSGHSYYDYARSVCARCPVSEACLDYALTNRIDMGMWGGLSPAQRAALRKKTA